MRYRECTALFISSLWSDCKYICLPTRIRRPPGSCWKLTPRESELSQTDDGIYYMAWSLWSGTWIYSPWTSLLVPGSWHCNSWCCARKPKQPNQYNQCKKILMCESNGCLGPNEQTVGICWLCDRVMWPCSLDQAASQSPSRSQIPPN